MPLSHTNQIQALIKFRDSGVNLFYHMEKNRKFASYFILLLYFPSFFRLQRRQQERLGWTDSNPCRIPSEAREPGHHSAHSHRHVQH